MPIPDNMLPNYERIFVPQIKSECWAASMAMMLRWKQPGLTENAARTEAKQRLGNLIGQEALADAEKSGLKRKDWVAACIAIGILPLPGKLFPAVAAISIRAGSPIFVHVKKTQGDGEYLHALVVVGADKNRVFVLDPENNPSKRVYEAPNWVNMSRPDAGSHGSWPIALADLSVPPTVVAGIFGTWGSIG